MRRVISALALVLAATAAARASTPSVADLDAQGRAYGNRKAVAIAVGRGIFAHRWPAQVMQIRANEFGSHLVIGVVLSGVHFHETLTRSRFDGEVATLVADVFTLAPAAEEVDLWATVPIDVGKGVIVSGDLAKPTARTVYTFSVRRGEPPDSIAARLHANQNLYIDEEWSRTAFTRTQ